MLDLEKIFPYVRRVQLKQDQQLSGQWQDLSHVFTFLASGNAEFIIEGSRYRISEGDAIIMPPYARHIITCEGGEKALIQYNVHFDLFSTPDRMSIPYRDVWHERGPKEAPQEERMLGGKVLLTSLAKEEQQMIRRLFMMMYAEYSRQEECSREMLRGLMLCILAQFVKGLKRQKGTPAMRQQIGSKPWTHISAAIDYLGTHYSNPDLSNEDIAAAVGVSPVYLTMEFKKYFGVSLHRYLMNLRLDQASYLLPSGAYSISEIARMTGFSSVQAFSKAFRASQGVSPREYANTHVSKSYDVFSTKQP